MIRLAAAAVLCLAAGAALAEEQSDGVAAEGILSDLDFFRLVSCGATPGGACKSPVLRWAKPDLRLTLRRGKDPAPTGFETKLHAASDPAIAAINGAGAGIRLQRTNGPFADITIIPTDLVEGTVMTEVAGFSGPGVMGVGYMTLWSDEADRITSAVILISTSISDADLPSVMLEEITQALGPLYDIENPAYDGVSILSQESNLTTTIAGQDAALLRWLYPPRI